MAAEDLPHPNDTTATPITGEEDDDELFGSNERSKSDDASDGAAVVIGGMEIDDAAPISIRQMLDANPPPPPLPSGWFLKPSLSSPSDHYYFNHDSGECRWEYPVASALGTGQSTSTAPVGAVGAAAVSQESLNATAAAAAAAVKSILKRSNSGTTTEEGGGGLDPTTTTTTTASHHKKQSPSSRKRVKTNGDVRERKEKEHRGGGSSSRESARSSSSSRHHHHEGRLSSSSSSSDPKEVRVLHILKKHRGSRRPASWRNPKITDSKEKAVADLRELISILESWSLVIGRLRSSETHFPYSTTFGGNYGRPVGSSTIPRHRSAPLFLRHDRREGRRTYDTTTHTTTHPSRTAGPSSCSSKLATTTGTVVVATATTTTTKAHRA